METRFDKSINTPHVWTFCCVILFLILLLSTQSHQLYIAVNKIKDEARKPNSNSNNDQKLPARLCIMGTTFLQMVICIIGYWLHYRDPSEIIYSTAIRIINWFSLAISGYLITIVGETTIDTSYRANKERNDTSKGQTPKWIQDTWSYGIIIHLFLLLTFECISYFLINNMYPIVIFSIYLYFLLFLISFGFAKLNYDMKQKLNKIIRQLQSGAYSTSSKYYERNRSPKYRQRTRSNHSHNSNNNNNNHDSNNNSGKHSASTSKILMLPKILGRPKMATAPTDSGNNSTTTGGTGIWLKKESQNSKSDQNKNISISPKGNDLTEKMSPNNSSPKKTNSVTTRDRIRTISLDLQGAMSELKIKNLMLNSSLNKSDSEDSPRKKNPQKQKRRRARSASEYVKYIFFVCMVFGFESCFV